jgi:hypothetical protein
MIRSLRPLLLLALALIACAATASAQELERPALPTTATIFDDGDPGAAPAPAETRTSYRALNLYGPRGDPMLHEVGQTVLQKRFKEIAPDFNVPPDAMTDALEISHPSANHSGRDSSAELGLVLRLRPPARSASKEMMQRLLDGLPAELGKLRRQMADAQLKEWKQERDQLVAQRDATRKRHGDLMAQARQLAGQLEPSAQRVRAAAAELEAEQQRIELDLLAKTARREAMEEQIAQQSKAIEQKTAEDPIVAELGKVVAARERRLELVRQMVKNGHASTTEIDEQVAVIAESRAKLLQHKREAALEAGGDILQTFNRELLTLSVDLRELTVRRDAIKKRLAELGEALSRLEEAQAADREASDARDRLQAVENALREAEPFAARAGDIRATVSNKVDTLEVDPRRAEPLPLK